MGLKRRSKAIAGIIEIISKIFSMFNQLPQRSVKQLDKYYNIVIM